MRTIGHVFHRFFVGESDTPDAESAEEKKIFVFKVEMVFVGILVNAVILFFCEHASPVLAVRQATAKDRNRGKPNTRVTSRKVGTVRCAKWDYCEIRHR